MKTKRNGMAKLLAAGNRYQRQAEVVWLLRAMIMLALMAQVLIKFGLG